MRRYRFGLESVLRARRAQEEVGRQQLAEANRRVQAAWASHRRSLEAYLAVAVGSGPVDHGQFLAARRHEAAMADGVERARRAAVEAEVQASTLFAAWVEVGKQVASLERLDQRRRDEWQAEALHLEVTAVDDVVAARWAGAGAERGDR